MENNQVKSEWLKSLPVVGHNVRILLKSGQAVTYSYARIASDEAVIHLGLIEKTEVFTHPTISATTQIPLEHIGSISYKDDWGKECRLDSPAQRMVNQILRSL